MENNVKKGGISVQTEHIFPVIMAFDQIEFLLHIEP